MNDLFACHLLSLLCRSKATGNGNQVSKYIKMMPNQVGQKRGRKNDHVNAGGSTFFIDTAMYLAMGRHILPGIDSINPAYYAVFSIKVNL